MSVTVIIPALNEEESIGQVLASIPLDVVDEIFVVDGGSSDDTVSIARAGGARIVHEPRRGYGRACAAGVRAASADTEHPADNTHPADEEHPGDILLFLDADGADDPSQIPDLLAPLLAKRADMVLGSRLAGETAPGRLLSEGAMPCHQNGPLKGMGWHQRFGNQLAAWLIRRLYGLRITDLSPFRAVDREHLLRLEMEEMRYGWPTEMIVKAARRGWHVVEIPVRYRPRLGGRSKISGTVQGTALATYDILRTIFRYTRG